MSSDGSAKGMSVDGEYVVNTLVDLAMIDSSNSSLVDGAPGEDEIGVVGCAGLPTDPRQAGILGVQVLVTFDGTF